MIISQSDLSAKIESRVYKNVTTKCQAQDTYNTDITTYTCTKPCPLPVIPDPTIMAHNWTNTTSNTEYQDTIK